MINPFVQIPKSFKDGEAYTSAWSCGFGFEDAAALMVNDSPVIQDEALYWVLMEWMDEYYQWDTSRDYNNVYSICTGEVVND